jgi:DUF4097 and DUF4098 domain-containing protein YvlB
MQRVFAILIMAGGIAAWAQESPERVTVPFSDPSRPKMVKVSLLNGGITVKGYNGKEVIVESRSRDGDSGRHRPDAPPGMRRIDTNSAGLQVEESENTITIGTERINNQSDIMVQVPSDTSLKLRTVNGGNIVVDGVSGDLDVDNTNGAVTLTHISGSAVAHALNGRVLVTLDHVSPRKAMSFSSLNGDVDVTLPADLKANVKMKTDNGEIYSDFDVKLDTSSRQPIVEGNRSSNGRYRVRFDHGMTGTINGGGPEIQFTTFNGTIFIRKAK